VKMTSPKDVLDISGSAFSFANGTGTFTLSVKNTSNFDETYLIKAGSAWVLDKEYTITVNKGATGTVSISGRYDPSLVGAGNEGLSVTVTTINGASVGTYVLDGAAFPAGPPAAVYVDISGENGTKDAYVDAVSGYEYMYAVTITNNDKFLKTASVKAEVVGGNGKWSLVYSDKDGGYIYSVLDTNSFKIAGYGSTVIYIKLMCRDASDTSVPSIKVEVSMPSGQALLTNSKGVSTIGNVATCTMSPQNAEMDSSDMSASGGDIYDSPSPVPVLTIVLTALMILAFIAMIWLGIKKGVFVRRR